MLCCLSFYVSLLCVELEVLYYIVNEVNKVRGKMHFTVTNAALKLWGAVGCMTLLQLFIAWQLVRNDETTSVMLLCSHVICFTCFVKVFFSVFEILKKRLPILNTPVEVLLNSCEKNPFVSALCKINSFYKVIETRWCCIMRDSSACVTYLQRSVHHCVKYLLPMNHFHLHLLKYCCTVLRYRPFTYLL